MGQLVDKIAFGSFTKQVIVIGLEGVGKTSVLEAIDATYVETIQPSPEFRVQVGRHKHLQLSCWTIGKSDKFRVFLKPFYRQAQGIIFVIDSTEVVGRLTETKNEISRLFDIQELKGVPIAFLANKWDLDNHPKIEQLTDILGLNKIQGRMWMISETCATKGDGVLGAVGWLEDRMEGRTQD